MRPPFLLWTMRRGGAYFLRMRRALIVLLFAAELQAAEPPFAYDRLLLPVIGPSGRSFVAQLTMLNAGADAQYYPGGCYPVGCDWETYPFPRGAVRKIGGMRADQETQFLYISKGAVVETSLTARDWNNRLTTPGADIPVVWPKDLRTGTLTLVGVPHTLRGTFDGRATLRIYAPDAVEPAAFRVRIRGEWDRWPHEPAPWAILDLTTSVRLDDPNGVPLTPGIVRVDGFERFLPEWGLGDVMVEIEAADPALKFWAMITITNNQNQSIRVIAPPAR